MPSKQEQQDLDFQRQQREQRRQRENEAEERRRRAEVLRANEEYAKKIDKAVDEAIKRGRK